MRVVVLGAGYAGLTVARRLERLLPAEADLILVDETGTHLLLHELHRVIRRPSLAETIDIPVRDILNRTAVREKTVNALDHEEQTVTFADGDRLTYDGAAVCLGSTTDFHDLEGVAQAGIPLEEPAHARQIRSEFLSANSGTAVVGGAGLSGIQVAGELAALAQDEDVDVEVRLLEAADEVAPTFDPTFGAAVRRTLRAQGVTVETGVAVESATASAISLADGREVASDVFVWTGGIRGPDALDGSRRSVAADLEYAPGTYVIGDAAEVIDNAGTKVPASAQTAVQQGRIAAANIADDLSDSGGDDPPTPARYAYEDPGWVVSVGDDAVAHLGPIIVDGEPARAAKALIGAGHLGSVGAITRATALVAQEFGWPGPSGAETTTLDGLLSALPTDPATPGAAGYRFINLALGAADTVTGDGPVDLTRSG